MIRQIIGNRIHFNDVHIFSICKLPVMHLFADRHHPSANGLLFDGWTLSNCYDIRIIINDSDKFMLSNLICAKTLRRTQIRLWYIIGFHNNFLQNYAGIHKPEFKCV